MDEQPTINISKYLTEMAEKQPYKRAVVAPAGRDGSGRVKYVQMTFSQLDKESDSLAAGLEAIGIKRGVRTILMVTPGIDFFTLTFALFKCGAVPVVVDPGMGIKRMLECLEQSHPKAFIGIPKAHVLRVLFPKFFKTVEVAVTVGRPWFWKGPTLTSLYKPLNEPYKSAQTQRDETAAILFTTGSTGPAKGVVYTHGNFDAQVKQIKSYFNISPEEIDLPTFPLFALFDPAIGMTAVIPDMDPTKPAFVNPVKIIEAIHNHGVTNMFASPALLNRVGGYGKKNNIRLPTLKRVVSAGAPVHPANIAQFSTMLNDDIQIYTPYGATEAVPVLSIGSHEILSETRQLSEQGFGTCVGRPINDMDVRIINITDDPIENWSDDLEVAEGEVGEITVKGDLVTAHYFLNRKSDLLAKIKDETGFRHRMGDLGWKDNNGRIWFCGRKSHRVTTKDGDMYSIPCEAIFNNHPAVYRSALVGTGPKGEQTPSICIELIPGKMHDRDEIKNELTELAESNNGTAAIKNILFHPAFPVDIRHNSKIFREKLAVWAEKQIRVMI